MYGIFMTSQITFSAPSPAPWIKSSRETALDLRRELTVAGTVRLLRRLPSASGFFKFAPSLVKCY